LQAYHLLLVTIRPCFLSGMDWVVFMVICQFFDAENFKRKARRNYLHIDSDSGLTGETKQIFWPCHFALMSGPVCQHGWVLHRLKNN
jgi:hypothetical protein